MQADRSFGNGGNGGGHGMDDRSNGAGGDSPLSYKVESPSGEYQSYSTPDVHHAMRVAQVRSRANVYAEVIDRLEDGEEYVLAAFLFGNQLALNRAWREGTDPALTMLGMEKETDINE